MERSKRAARPVVVPVDPGVPRRPLAAVFADRCFSAPWPTSTAGHRDQRGHHRRIPNRRYAVGMVMREAKPLQRMPGAKRWELPWVSRSRMAMAAASFADAL